MIPEERGKPYGYDFDEYHLANEEVLASLDDPKNRALFLKALNAYGKLRPVPEIFWKVDRTLEDYRARFGFDVVKFLDDLSAEIERGKKTLLELGPGNGRSKEQRHRHGLSDKYRDYALSDNLYYPVDNLVASMIDFRKIEEVTGELSDAEGNQITDYLYKTLVIRHGETSQDDFHYDAEVMRALVEDPNNIKSHLAHMSEKLSVAGSVPTAFRTRNTDSEVIYPEKIVLTEQNERIQAAIRALAGAPRDFLRDDIDSVDAYALVNVHPAGVIMTHFNRMQLADAQVDVAMGVRSTVYLEGESYQAFLNRMDRVLKPGGVYVDDSVRENFGDGYRIAHLLLYQRIFEADRKVNMDPQLDYDINLSIITGPGIPGEDYHQAQVPLAIAMSKDCDYAERIKAWLDAGYQVRSLKEVADDEEFLGSLDREGKVLRQVQAMKEAFKTRGTADLRDMANGLEPLPK